MVAQGLPSVVAALQDVWIVLAGHSIRRNPCMFESVRRHSRFATARSCLMPDSHNSCTLPAMVTSSCWNVTRLRCIHKRVTHTLLMICHMRVHTAVYAVTSSSGTALAQPGVPWINLARVCLHNWRGNFKVVQAPSILLSNDR